MEISGDSLTQEVERLRKADRAKDEFLALLCHELRAPLHVILGYVELLRTPRMSESERMEAIDAIERNARTQARLVADLLNISCIVRGKLAFERQRFNPQPIIRQAVEDFRFTVAAKQIKLELEIADLEEGLWGDPQRLQQILVNLLTNAVKFTSRGGEIRLQTQLLDSWYEIRISDTGRGISTASLPHIFDHLWQGDEELQGRHSGFGLGLAIVKHLTELHGGEVWAESMGPGQGSSFCVRLPRADGSLS